MKISSNTKTYMQQQLPGLLTTLLLFSCLIFGDEYWMTIFSRVVVGCSIILTLFAVVIGIAIARMNTWPAFKQGYAIAVSICPVSQSTVIIIATIVGVIHHYMYWLHVVATDNIEITIGFYTSIVFSIICTIFTMVMVRVTKVNTNVESN